MPWSVKAQSLLLQQYAAVGAASTGSLNEAVQLLQQASARGIATQDMASTYQHRLTLATQYVAAYRRYCWPVNSLDDIRKVQEKLKPGDAVAFHLVRGVAPPPAAAPRTGRGSRGQAPVQTRSAVDGPQSTYVSGILPGR